MKEKTTTRPETGLSKESRLLLTFITGAIVSAAFYVDTIPGVPNWLAPLMAIIAIIASGAREIYGYTDSKLAR